LKFPRRFFPKRKRATEKRNQHLTEKQKGDSRQKKGHGRRRVQEKRNAFKPDIKNESQ